MCPHGRVLRHRASDRASTQGADCYMVEIAAPHMQTAKHTLTDNNDGTYTVRYTPVYQVRFCRYRFSPTGELKYRGAVG